MTQNIVWFDDISMNDHEMVGGKNASLGEMIKNLSSAGVAVPNGFATTTSAYREFLNQKGLAQKIHDLLGSLDVEDVIALAKAGKVIREWIINTPFLPEFEQEVKDAFLKLNQDASFAVRSSATAEDMPEASFAGQQETFLNVSGIDNILLHIKHVFASLYNDRAISYRVHHNFVDTNVALSAGIQQMVRSDKSASGVIFTMDTESGFKDVVFITSAYGLGELVVQGEVNPDEFYVHKPTLEKGMDAILRRNLGTKAQKLVFSDANSKQLVTKEVVEPEKQQVFSITNQDVTMLARYAVLIEKHYGRPMDIEWAKDGIDNKLYILQARPETVKSHSNVQVLERYHLHQKADLICEGRAIGQKIGQGKAKLLKSISEMNHILPGDVLVTDMTDPDWEPIMKRAAAIVTNRGGRTCHAAIIARELGIPAVVGTSDATTKIIDNTDITVSCSEGDTGHVYQGLLDFSVKKINLDKMPEIPFKIMLNVGNPDKAFDFQFLPNAGVGLARLEFIITQMIGIHPKALLDFDKLPNNLQEQIYQRTLAYGCPIEYYIERLREGISTIAAAFYPKPVIVRLSDFKTNEYANLLGGQLYEPHEENPMLGFRGAARYISSEFQDCFELECRAIKRVREEMGLDNVEVMIPFVRTLSEAEQVVSLLAKNGLKRGENNLRIIMMCELPSNALLAEEFLEYFDGFSIGSNDLTQLTLGLDRDSGIIAYLFDERNDAVKKLLANAILACKKANKYIGICGQGPSDHPDLAKWLMQQGIQSMSLNPDSVIDTWMYLAK